MGVLGGLFGFAGTLVCCGVLFVVLIVALLFWFLNRQPAQQVSYTAPTPPVQQTIEHPTVVGTSTAPPPTAPAPAAPPAPPTAPLEAPAPPTAPVAAPIAPAEPMPSAMPPAAPEVPPPGPVPPSADV